MKYITGIFALNLSCSLRTTGDWHTSSLEWSHPTIKESKDSIFGEYGIEDNNNVPENPGTHKVANHIRALLDLLADQEFSIAQGMRKDFIGDDTYTLEIFDQVLCLNSQASWPKIDSFMGKEYGMRWLNFLKGKELPNTAVDRILAKEPHLQN